MRCRRLAIISVAAAACHTPLVPVAARPVRHAPARTEIAQPPQQQQQQQQPSPQTGAQQPGRDFTIEPYGAAAKLLEAPVSTLFPGNTGARKRIANPAANDPEAIQRGMGYFNMFNCSGCHAPNAGGGMGPALSNSFSIYGGEPENIYLSIYQGRPSGMPAWGAMLSESIIWDLVAYVGSISKEPSTTWGKTLSRETFKVEQVPAEFAETARPWSETQRFSFGQKPNEKR